jgi:hypothetical protein
MSITPLQHDNARARYDSDSGIAHITYTGYLTGEASTAVYDWLADVTQAIGIENMRGEVFDFRDVTEFMPDNLMDARRNSRRYNVKNDVRRLPVAMIVKDFYQEEILRGPMQNVRENARKTIVRTMDDALGFIRDWHTQQTESDEA